MTWTPELVLRLEHLLAARHSHSTIARMLGVTRGSIAGKVRRLKACQGDWPIWKRDAPTAPELVHEVLDPKVVRSAELRAGKLFAKLKTEQCLRKSAEEELEGVSSKLAAVQDAANRSNPRYLKGETLRSSGNTTAVLAVCDWHSESRVDKEQVNGVNEFNLEIVAERIGRLWLKTVRLLEFSRHLSKIDDLVVWLGGDLINGDIREEFAESNFLGPSEAILFVQDRVAEGLSFLLRECNVNHITVVTSIGNHARTTDKMRAGTAHLHSWEYLAYCNLQKLFSSESRISFQVGKGYHNYLEVQGRLIRFHHGDALRGGTGVGGLMIPLRKKIAQWDACRRADLTVCGHFHQFIDGWNFVVCGALVGFDSFAMKSGFDFQPPTQTFITISRRFGKTMAVPVFVGEEDM